MEPKQMTAGSGETGRWRASRQRAGRPRVLPGAKNRAGGNRARGRQPVYRKSDSAIMVMKAAEDGRRYDAAHVLDGAINRSVLVERPMSPQPYNRWRTSSESGVSALRNNQMVDALASDRSDQPFGEAVLPRRARGDGLVTDAHCAQSACDGSAVDAIPIADQIARGLIPRECLRDLARDPFRGRIG